MNKSSVDVLGIMSGSSMDGLDFAVVHFDGLEDYLDGEAEIEWVITSCETKAFPEDIRNLLVNLPDDPLPDFLEKKSRFNRWISNQTLEFLSAKKIDADLISMHGHTIWHRPERGYSLQIPNGSRLSAQTGLPIITDFRQSDIALGGSGTPLAPVVDRDLFPEYDAWLNIGGIANISYHRNDAWIAYDICPANQLLNHVARQTGRAFDRNGAMARSGQVIPKLLRDLNDHEYYRLSPPKSLDNSYIKTAFIENMLSVDHNEHDLLCTLTEHITEKINVASIAATPEKGKIFVTGGGANNGYLMDRLHSLSKGKRHYLIPDREIVEYKEALLMAWAGLLRLFGRPNMLSSVTGAETSTSGGAIYDAHGKLNAWTKNNA